MNRHGMIVVEDKPRFTHRRVLTATTKSSKGECVTCLSTGPKLPVSAVTLLFSFRCPLNIPHGPSRSHPGSLVCIFASWLSYKLIVHPYSPWVILNDFGGAFAMGAVGGGIWHGIKGARNSPRVCKLSVPRLGMLLI
jgi:hypothetical protein